MGGTQRTKKFTVVGTVQFVLRTYEEGHHVQWLEETVFCLIHEGQAQSNCDVDLNMRDIQR